MIPKSLDIKLAKIKADPSCKEFIIADAKDADMAFGIASPGKSPEHHAAEGTFRSLPEYRECIRQVVYDLLGTITQDRRRGFPRVRIRASLGQDNDSRHCVAFASRPRG